MLHDYVVHQQFYLIIRTNAFKFGLLLTNTKTQHFFQVKAWFFVSTTWCSFPCNKHTLIHYYFRFYLALMKQNLWSFVNFWLCINCSRGKSQELNACVRKDMLVSYLHINIKRHFQKYIWNYFVCLFIGCQFRIFCKSSSSGHWKWTRRELFDKTKLNFAFKSGSKDFVHPEIEMEADVLYGSVISLKNEPWLCTSTMIKVRW